MSTALTISGAKPSFLAKTEPKKDSKFLADLGTSMPLPVLSFRGKIWRLRKDGQEINTKLSELDVVLVDTRPHNSKRYFDAGYDPDTIAGPRCSSVDGKTPDVADPISKTCAACPNNEWGSATRNGKKAAGKACSDYRRLVVWPVGLAREGMTPQACVLDVAATSLRAPKGSGLMMLREYVAALVQNGIPETGYVVRLSFNPEAEYPQIIFTPNRYVTREEYDVVQSWIGHDDVAEVLGGDAAEVAPGGRKPIEEVVEEPAPEPKAKKAKAKKEPEPEPEEVAEAEEAEEADEASESSDDDLLGELEKLLGGG